MKIGKKKAGWLLVHNVWVL